MTHREREMKVRITEISSIDAWYPDRNKIIGQVGTFVQNSKSAGFVGGTFKFDKPILNEAVQSTSFYQIKYEKAEEEAANDSQRDA